MISIRLADNEDHQRWDEFVLSSADTGPYHLFAWKKAIESAYRHKTYYLVAEDSKKDIKGIFPLVLMKPPILKGTLVSLPFCDYGSMFTNDSGSASLLLDHALELSNTLSSKLEIRCKQENSLLDNTGRFGTISHKSRMVLELPGTSGELWDQFKSKLRSQVRKPMKEGLEFKMGSIDMLDEFYGVFCNNMRALGSPVHSKKWIRSVLESFGEHARTGVVFKENTPVAAGVILTLNYTVSIPWASTIRDYNRLSPNMLLYWGFLKFACDNGFKYFDFGRSTPGEGTYRFKEQWGAKPHPLYWYIEGANKDKPSLTNGRMRDILETSWSRLPLGMANTLGPLVRRYISL